MKPYWTSPDGAIVVYHARMEDVIAAGVVDVPRVKLIHADPPYGIDVQTDRSKTRGGIAHARRSFPKVVGDRDAYDPSALLAIASMP